MSKQQTDHIGDANKMVTAVDTIIKYCEEKLHTSVNSHGGAYTSIINFCKQQAKEMEKEQIVDAYANGQSDTLSMINQKINKMKDIPKEFNEIINKNFWDLI
jgi:hypothetical protein